MKREGSLFSKRRLVEDVVELVETEDVDVMVKELKRVSNGKDEDMGEGKTQLIKEIFCQSSTTTSFQSKVLFLE